MRCAIGMRFSMITRIAMSTVWVFMRGITTMPFPDPLATAPFPNGPVSKRVFCLKELPVDLLILLQ